MYIIYNNGFHFDIFMSVLNVFTLSIILSLPFPSPSISQLVLLLSSLWVCVCLGVHVCVWEGWVCMYQCALICVHIFASHDLHYCYVQENNGLFTERFLPHPWLYHYRKISLPPFTQLGNCEIPVSKIFNNWMLMESILWRLFFASNHKWIHV